MGIREKRFAGFLALAALIYIAVLAYLSGTGLYEIQGAHNDRFFSADDVYFVEHFFSTTLDDSPRIIKHPLLIVFGWLFSLGEREVFGRGIPLSEHYLHIVAMQICVSLLTLFYLYRLFAEMLRLEEKTVYLLLGAWAVSFSPVFYTFLGESFLYSGLLLTMTFYYAGRKNIPWLVALGALTAGITVTNGVLWAVIVVLSDLQAMRKLGTFSLGGGLFCLLVGLSPVRDVFFGTLIIAGLRSIKYFSDSFGMIETLRRIFYAFFGSTSFYLRTQDVTPFGEFAGDALSFLPAASLPTTVFGTVWAVMLAVSAVWNRRDPILYPSLGVLGVNLLLHGVIQYGLKEASLYSLHHMTAQFLILALLLREDRVPKPMRIGLRVFLVLYMLWAMVGNLHGYRQMLGTL